MPPRISQSPLSSMFHSAREEIIAPKDVQPGQASVDLELQPDQAGRSAVEASASVSEAGASGSLRTSLQGQATSGMLFRPSLALRTHGDVKAEVAGWHPQHRLGVFASVSSSGQFQDSATPAAHVTAGARVHNPTDTWGAGVSAGLYGDTGTRCWMIGAQRSGVRWGAEMNVPTMAWKAAHSAFSGAGCSVPGLAQARKAAASAGASVSAAVGLAQEDAYALTLGVASARQELVLGYVQHWTLRRRIANPLEKHHVKGIWNYLDIGAELRRSLRDPSQAGVAVGLAWQLNRSLLFRAVAGTDRSAVSTTLRTWTEPMLTITGSLGCSGIPRPDSLRTGLHVHLGPSAAPRYRRAQLPTRKAAPSIAFEPVGPVDGVPTAPRVLESDPLPADQVYVRPAKPLGDSTAAPGYGAPAEPVSGLM